MDGQAKDPQYSKEKSQKDLSVRSWMAKQRMAMPREAILKGEQAERKTIQAARTKARKGEEDRYDPKAAQAKSQRDYRSLMKTSCLQQMSWKGSLVPEWDIPMIPGLKKHTTRCAPFPVRTMLCAITSMYTGATARLFPQHTWIR